MLYYCLRCRKWIESDHEAVCPKCRVLMISLKELQKKSKDIEREEIKCGK